MVISKTYGRLNENGELEYFTGTYIRIQKKVLGRVRTFTVYNPTEEEMNSIGWYRVVNVDEVGTDQQVGNIIYHYTGEESDVVIGVDDSEGEN